MDSIGEIVLKLTAMEEIKTMATREGFLEVFWSRVQHLRGIGRMDSFHQVYDRMEEQYDKEYGRPLFPSWDAFRQYMYRHR